MLFLHQTVLFYVYNSVKMTKSVVKGRTLSHPLIFYNIIGNESVLLWSEALRLSKKKKKDNFSDCNVFEAAGKSSHVDAPISSLPTVCRRKSLSMEKSHWSLKVNTIYCTWPPCWGHRGPRPQLWLVVLVLNSSETSLCLRLTFYHSSSQSVKTFSTYSRFHSVTSSVANIHTVGLFWPQCFGWRTSSGVQGRWVTFGPHLLNCPFSLIVPLTQHVYCMYYMYVDFKIFLF